MDPLKLCKLCDNLFPPEPRFTVIQKMNEYFLLYPGNCIVPDEDIPKLEMHLGQAKDEIEAYETEIERIEGILEELKSRRATLLKASARMSEMIRPSIRRLPLEILLSIFLIYCENAYGPIPKVTMSHPALILGFVCSQWREIVHSMPIFWSTIQAHYLLIHRPSSMHGPVYINYHTQTRRIARFYLEKSKALPLHISLNSYSSKEDAFVELAKQSRRWRSLKLRSFTDFTHFPVAFPNLEALSLHGQCWDWNGTLPAKISTPSLRRLVSTGENLVIGTRLDTHSLEKLTVRSAVDFALFNTILRLSPNLSSLELSNVFFYGVPATLNPPASIPVAVLEISRLTSGSEQNWRILFEKITMTCLRTFSISSHRPCILDFHDDDKTTSALGRFLTGTPLLTSLSLSQIHFRHLDDLFAILRTLSRTLSHLGLFNCKAVDNKWDEFMRLLVLPSEFLVNLKDLEFDYLRWTHKSDSLFFRMVSSRSMALEPAKRLSSLRVRCPEENVDTLRLGLRPFSEEGLKVHVSLFVVSSMY